MAIEDKKLDFLGDDAKKEPFLDQDTDNTDEVQEKWAALKKPKKKSHKGKKNKKHQASDTNNEDSDNDNNEPEEEESSNKSKRKLGDEVTIKIHPRKVLKFCLIVLLLIGVFFLGRFSADCLGTAVVDAEDVENQFSFSETWESITGIFSTKESAREENPNATESVITGEVTNEELSEESKVESDIEVVADSEESMATDDAEVSENQEASVDDVQDEVASGIAEEEVEESSAQSSGSQIVTDYSAVSFALDDVTTDWKDTWGKITKIKFTLKNGADGIIKPDYFEIMVEGYGDMTKTFTAPIDAIRIDSGETVTTLALVSEGFAYSPVTTPNINNVEVTVFLYDNSGKEIGMAKNKFDLEG